MFTIENLSFKHAHQQDYFFKGLCTSFPSETVSFIKGKNGVGKSTLFRALRGAINENEHLEGFITCAGIRYQLGSCRITQIPQKIALVLAPNRTVAENLQLAVLGAFPGLKKLPKISKVFPLLLSAGIALEVRVSDLSGGQQQLVGIVAMMQKEPQVLLLDEPTAALDAANARLVIESLKVLSREKKTTILVVTHDNELLAEHAHEGYFELVETAQEGRQMIKC